MNYEKILLIIVAFASVIQFYLTFVKGRSNVKEPGNEVYRLRSNAMKLNLLGLIFVFIIFYLLYALIKSSLSYLGIVIVIYALLCIFDFSKVKVITENGIGQKNFYNNQFYNYTLWEDMIEFEWSSKRNTMLIFNFNKNGNVITKDWEVCEKDKPEVEKLFMDHVKMKIKVETKLELEEGQNI